MGRRGKGSDGEGERVREGKMWERGSGGERVGG